MADGVFRTRSLGAAASGLPDQYADGTAAKLWELYIGDHTSRTTFYKDFLVKLLKSHKCEHILDVACGTGIDSILLLEAGFRLTSVDASDKMLKYALKTRWNNRHDSRYSDWVIEEANWLSLAEDISLPDHVAAQGGFDAVICMGNSFAHLPDNSGTQREHQLALDNFARFVKPNGVLVIDHRNYDYTLKTGRTPEKNIYYNSKYIQDIKTSVLYQNGLPTMVTLDYTMDIEDMLGKRDETDSEIVKTGRLATGKALNRFRLSYFPHQMERFRELLMGAFGAVADITTYGDFVPLGELEDPAFYVHVVRKPPTSITSSG